MKKNKSIYETHDNDLASILHCLGAKVNSTQWRGKSLFFLFGDKQLCEKVISGYYKDSLLVNPRNLLDSKKIIKSMIFNK